MSEKEAERPISGDFAIPILREELQVEVRKKVTASVRVEKSVIERDEEVTQDLVNQTVSIERVPINRYIEEPAVTRQEGDVTVIPVMEELLITRKQLVLKEEIRIHRRQTHSQHREQVTLKSETVQITRSQITGDSLGLAHPDVRQSMDVSGAVQGE